MYILSENEDECTNLNNKAPSMSYQFGHQLDQRELRWLLASYLSNTVNIPSNILKFWTVREKIK